jgi:hypothetical protein
MAGARVGYGHVQAIAKAGKTMESVEKFVFIGLPYCNPVKDVIML